MSTPSIQRPWRPALTAPFVALVLAGVLLVLGAQASLLWGTRTSTPVGPAPTVFLPASSGISAPTAHLPAGCRPKVGC
jgi:hypothetical protein